MVYNWLCYFPVESDCKNPTVSKEALKSTTRPTGIVHTVVQGPAYLRGNANCRQFANHDIQTMAVAFFRVFIEFFKLSGFSEANYRIMDFDF